MEKEQTPEKGLSCWIAIILATGAVGGICGLVNYLIVRPDYFLRAITP